MRVAEVLVEVTAGWLSSPHSIDMTITSVNGCFLEDCPKFHGHQVDATAGLETFGDIAQGSAFVVVPWTSDSVDRVVDTEYTICAHIIFADSHHGEETCTVIDLQ